MIVQKSEEMGLDLTINKTECVTVSKKELPICHLIGKGIPVKQVQSFRYLGFRITSNVKCKDEITKRIALAKDSFSKIHTILNNRNITMETKTRVLRTYVWSVLNLLIYGCEWLNAGTSTKKRNQN